MKFLEPFLTSLPGKGVQFTREQSSRFAKQVADDYNPIHDIAAKRFCVPGDLLFALALSRFGLSEQMTFTFAGMVNDGVPLAFAGTEDGQVSLRDQREKEYLRVAWSGAVTRDEALIEQIIRSYVRFSGHNFPHILQPLMAEHNVMINPERPLVIYESMALDLATLDMTAPVVELSGSSMEVDGKRGNAVLRFRFLENGKEVGKGEKLMVLSGLRPYEQEQMDWMINAYDERKRDKVE